jgi:hypothetical protein
MVGSLVIALTGKQLQRSLLLLEKLENSKLLLMTESLVIDLMDRQVQQ